MSKRVTVECARAACRAIHTVEVDALAEFATTKCPTCGHVATYALDEQPESVGLSDEEIRETVDEESGNESR